jgi:putative aldouronate transport system substrate-binding protein
MKIFSKAFFVSVLTLCFAALLVLTGCSQSGGAASSTSAPGPLGKYTPEISITLARVGGQLFTDADENKTQKWKDFTDNQWFRNYKEQLGINLSYKWISPDEESNTVRWITAISSGDVPDFARVNANVYKLLYEADLSADMTKLWDKYASPEYKDMVTAVDKAQMTFEGKLMGFPIPSYGIGECNIVFIRKDWLDKAGLPVPQTFDDLITVARVFNTIKPAGANTIPIGLWNGTQSWTAYFNAYGAYLDLWLEKDGKLVYSSVQPEVRDALLNVQSAFKEGLINKDFMAAKEDNVREYMANGQIGIFCQPVWETAMSLSALNINDPSNRMTYLYPPSVKGKSYLAQTHVPEPVRMFVSAKSKYPEVGIKMANLTIKYEYEDSAYVVDGNLRPYQFNPWYQLISYAEPVISGAEAIREAIETGSLPEWSKRYSGIPQFWADYQRYKQTGDPGIRWVAETWGGVDSSEIITYNAVKENRLLFSAYLGHPTDTMQLKQSTINNELTAAMTEVIAGADISVYDRAVQKWFADGGIQITSEVNDWYVKSGSK